MNERGLPKNVHLLTFRDTGDKSFLVRLAHLFEVECTGLSDESVELHSFPCYMNPLCLAMELPEPLHGMLRSGQLAAREDGPEK